MWRTHAGAPEQQDYRVHADVRVRRLLCCGDGSAAAVSEPAAAHAARPHEAVRPGGPPLRLLCPFFRLSSRAFSFQHLLFLCSVSLPFPASPFLFQYLLPLSSISFSFKASPSTVQRLSSLSSISFTFAASPSPSRTKRALLSAHGKKKCIKQGTKIGKHAQKAGGKL